MSNSTHRVEVVPVTLTPHPNADALSIVRVHDGYQVVVRTSDWLGATRGAYAPPDSVIPPGLVPGIEGRVKAIRLRGEISEGLLLPPPHGSEIGDDVAGLLGITHYNPPPPPTSGGDEAPSPTGYVPVYDLEAARRYGAALVVGERVIATEKIHGANGRWTFRNGEMHAGSRTGWKAPTDSTGREVLWWAALRAHPEIREWCEAHPGAVIYGEVYGQVQDLRYGIADARIVVFDIYTDSRFLDHDAARAAAPKLPWVPVLYDGPHESIDAIAQHAEGLSVLAAKHGASHVREGCVIRPAVERRHDEAVRVVLKLIGRGYLSRK